MYTSETGLEIKSAKVPYDGVCSQPSLINMVHEGPSLLKNTQNLKFHGEVSEMFSRESKLEKAYSLRKSQVETALVSTPNRHENENGGSKQKNEPIKIGCSKKEECGCCDKVNNLSPGRTLKLSSVIGPASTHQEP